MKVAIIYDRVNKWGGAERVLDALHELYPDAPLYTLVYNERSANWAKKFHVRPTFLQKFSFAQSNHEYFSWIAPVAFESLDLSDYDVVISVTSEFAKGVITHPHTLHVCYCLTPTRYLWSGYDEYFKGSFFRSWTRPLVKYLRNWDLIASTRPDAYIAISQIVATRIKKFYKQDVTEVIYPPVALGAREDELSAPQPDSYFLIVSRLVTYKRIDIAIQACNKLRLPLTIVGAGRELKNLKRIAGPTVSFVESLTDGELVEYYKKCRALLFPGLEDFGIVMAEAARFGKPVIAYGKGGGAEIVIPGKTGELFDHQTIGSLISVLENFDPMRYNQNDIYIQGKKFSSDVFKERFRKGIEKLFKEYVSINEVNKNI